MTPDAKIFFELWQSAERELQEWGPNGRSTAAVLDELLRRINYDGADINSLTVGELRRAIGRTSDLRPGWMGDIGGTPYGPSDR